MQFKVSSVRTGGVLLTLLLSFPLLAQEKDSVTVALDPVVITGTRLEQQKSKVPGSISVVTRETIEQSGHTSILPTLASQVPGLFLNARGVIGYGVGPNSGGTISIRGISGTPNSRILVLIDGQPQFMGIFGHPIADAYTSTDIERVEVLKGAASLLYGSNAMGGAINIITRQARSEGLSGSTQLAYGSFNSSKYNGNISYKKRDFEAVIAFNSEHTDGFREEGKDEFDNTTGYLKVGYQLNKSWAATIDGQLANATYFQPGTTEVPLENDRRKYLRGRAALSLENTFEKIQGAFKVFYNAGKHEFTDGFRSTDVNQGFTFYQNLKLLPDNIITVGVDYKNFGGKAENDSLPPPARVGFDEKQRVNEVDFYALVEHTFLEKLTLEGGIRFIQNSQYGGNTTPAAGLAYQATESTTLKASAAKAFRSPAIVDLFLFPPSNDELQPEEVWNYEIGLMQSLMNKKVSLELSAYISEGDNLIQEVPSSTPGPPQRRNTGAFSNQGVDFQARYFFNTDLDVMMNYSFLNVSETVLYAPRHTLGVVANYDFHHFGLQLDVQQLADLSIALSPEVPAESYTMANARLRWSVTDWIHLFVEGKNLLDQTYQVELGYPMPGINVLGGFHYKF
ncbi:MAG: TonB-dependent receptor [Cyclobacteriaceae bacterium]